MRKFKILAEVDPKNLMAIIAEYWTNEEIIEFILKIDSRKGSWVFTTELVSRLKEGIGE